MTYLFHSTVHVRPGLERVFEEARPDVEAINHAPGFVERFNLRDRDHPGTYFYVSVWDTFEQLAAYRRTDDARRLVARSSGVDYLADPIRRVDCEIVMQEVGPFRRAAGAVVHSTSVVKPGMETEFETRITSGDDRAALAAADGFVERLLLKDLGEPGAYHYVSMWESFELNRAYQQEPSTRRRIETSLPSDLLAQPLDRRECYPVEHVRRSSPR